MSRVFMEPPPHPLRAASRPPDMVPVVPNPDRAETSRRSLGERRGSLTRLTTRARAARSSPARR